MNFSTKLISIVLVIILVIIGLVWAIYLKGVNIGGDRGFTTSVDDSSKNFDLNNWNIYTNDDYNFLLRYPDTLRVSEFEDNGSKVILIQESDSVRGFQIFISAWDESVESFSIERIRRDLPNLAMHDVEDVHIGTGEGYPAILFKSENKDVGETREVWFVYPQSSQGVPRSLYQVRAPLSFDTELSWMMSTWTFRHP